MANDYFGYPGYGAQMGGYYPRGYQMMQPSGMQAQSGLIKVTGLEGAKAYQMPPNSMAALFDAGSDVFFFKTTDGAGFPTIKAYAFSPIDMEKSGNTEYVTRREFEELKGMIVNGLQPVRNKTDTDTGE